MSKSFSFDVLSDGSLLLTPGEACLQTTAEQAHRVLPQALLEGRASGTFMGAFVDTLETFLSPTNFDTLRVEDPEFAGDTGCRVRRSRHEDGVVRWEVVQPK